MASWPMRSWRWATPSSPRRFRTAPGNSQFGRSVGLRAPGMFLEILRRTVASTGGTLVEVPTHAPSCRNIVMAVAPTSRSRSLCAGTQCPCGIGPVQRDLYSAFLAAHLDVQTFLPSIAQDLWESAETRLRAAIEATIQRANAGQVLPQSMGIPRAGARLPESLVTPSKSLASPGTRKSWHATKNLPAFRRESLREEHAMSGDRQDFLERREARRQRMQQRPGQKPSANRPAQPAGKTPRERQPAPKPEQKTGGAAQAGAAKKAERQEATKREALPKTPADLEPPAPAGGLAGQTHRRETPGGIGRHLGSASRPKTILAGAADYLGHGGDLRAADSGNPGRSLDGASPQPADRRQSTGCRSASAAESAAFQFDSTASAGVND